MQSQLDQDSLDYNDKSQDDNTGDDYIEKRDNSDDLNNTDPLKIAGIDGIVEIITKSKENADTNKEEETSIDESEAATEDDSNESPSLNVDSQEHSKSDSEVEDKAKENSDTDENDKVAQKENLEKVAREQSENEAKKAKILNSVDELKERHAAEQRLISEKVKEEEMSKEELERDSRPGSQEFDKYNNKLSINWKKGNKDYEEYDDKILNVNDKYKIASPTSRTRHGNEKPNTSPKKSEDSERISLFTNPQAYLVNQYDDNEENPTTNNPNRNKNLRNKGKKKFSSRYVEPASNEQETVRISLVPQDEDSKEGEPTLYFPKKRTSRRRKTTTTATPEPDSYEAETVQESAKKEHTTHLLPPYSVTPHTTTYKVEPTRTEYRISEETAPSAADTEISASDVSEDANPVTDPLPASTNHKEKKKPENFEYEKGHGGDHHSSHEEEHGEHGKKAYEVRANMKTQKPPKDTTRREKHEDSYDDHGGSDEHHHDESGHYGHHRHEEQGKKHAKYEESGKHSKGHSTKGSHDIHKKEEYEKNVEFFEEDGDFGEDEKHGGYQDEKKHSKGGNFKHGGLKAEHEGSSKGSKGHYDKGGFGHYDKGHKSAEGHDHHGRNDKKNVIHDGKDVTKKWIYHHGHPPRTANLVVIDRRTDPYLAGPRYYG